MKQVYIVSGSVNGILGVYKRLSTALALPYVQDAEHYGNGKDYIEYRNDVESIMIVEHEVK